MDLNINSGQGITESNMLMLFSSLPPNYIERFYIFKLSQVSRTQSNERDVSKATDGVGQGLR